MAVVLKSAALYFALVFAVGFVLGTIRVLWVAPQLGTRTAELLEAPVMLTVSILAARWIVRRPSAPSTASGRLGTGLMALAFMLGAEFGLVAWLRGISFREYVATRDPLSGAVYYLTLVLFALLPNLMAKNRLSPP
jgi:hypothetical protein